MTHTGVASIRRDFANRIAALARLRSNDLIEALAHVPREDFVGPGPWKILPSWLDRLAESGRLLVPLTVTRPIAGVDQIGVGHMLRIERRTDSYVARFISPVGIFHCIGARTDRGEEILRAAFAQRDVNAVRCLRRDIHTEGPMCWLHGSSFCLSRTAC